MNHNIENKEEVLGVMVGLNGDEHNSKEYILEHLSVFSNDLAMYCEDSSNEEKNIHMKEMYGAVCTTKGMYIDFLNEDDKRCIAFLPGENVECKPNDNIDFKEYVNNKTDFTHDELVDVYKQMIKDIQAGKL